MPPASFSAFTYSSTPCRTSSPTTPSGPDSAPEPPMRISPSLTPVSAWTTEAPSTTVATMAMMTAASRRNCRDERESANRSFLHDQSTLTTFERGLCPRNPNPGRRQRPSLANDPAPHRRSPTFVQERADLAHREIAESQMLERAAAAQQLAGEQDAEDAQQT